MLRTITLLGVLAITAGLQCNNAYAQKYPFKAIRLIVPVTAGGGVDTVARLISARLNDTMKVPVVVENRVGADGSIGAAFVAKAPPDGYTVLIASSSHVAHANLRNDLSYNLLKDFAPVSLITSSPQLLVAHSSVPVKSVSELIALAKSKPGALSFASSGNGGAPHLAGELFKSMAGIDIRHISYKGGGPAMVDVLGGRVELYFSSVTGAMPQVKAGKLKALAITSSNRNSLIPDIPTLSESGLPGYFASNWYSFLVPAGTPSLVIEKLNHETVSALKVPELAGKLISEGFEIIASTPAELGAFMSEEMAKTATLIKAANIRLD